MSFYKLKFCKSVLHHHSTVQINHQPDATVFQFIILTFIYSSTCFGRFPAHHQELSDCSGSLWFYLGLISNLTQKILLYLHIIHLLKSSTCFEHYPAHLQEVCVVIVYMTIPQAAYIQLRRRPPEDEQG